MGCIKAKIALLLALAAVTAAVLPTSASALTLREGSSVQVAEGEVVADDLYAFGDTITIDGTVEGDLVAFGQIVVVNGEVRGALISAAQTVRVPGSVGGTARVAGATVDVSGRVAGDVLAGAAEVVVSGDVGRDLAVGAQHVGVSGSIGRNVLAGCSSLTIAGDVGGDVQAQAESVTVAEPGQVDGNLEYWSNAEADVRGDVAGQTVRHDPPEQARQREHREPGGVAGAMLAVFLAWVQAFVGFALLGLALVFAFARGARAGSQAAIARVLPSLGVGLAVFFATPMAIGFVFVVGLFIGAWWLAFVLGATYWLLLLAGMVIGSLAVGRVILRRTASAGEPALAWSVLLGLAIVWIVAAVPVIGWLAAWVVMLAGTGSLVLVWLGKDAPPVPAEPAGMPAVPPTPPAAVPPPMPPTPPASGPPAS